MSEEIKSTAPDLSRIVNLIMENPKLIEEISAMAKSAEEPKTQAEPEKAEESTAASVEPTYESGNSRSRSCGVEIIRISLIPANISAEIG